jgi:hypothetical protein
MSTSKKRQSGKTSQRRRDKAVTAETDSTKAIVPARLQKAVNELMVGFRQARLGRSTRRPPAMVDYENPDGLPLALPDPKADQALFWTQLAMVAGSPHAEAQLRFLVDLQGVLASKHGTEPALSGALAQILDIGPRDGLEGMLAVQMVSVHHVAMKLLADNNGESSLVAATFRLHQAARFMRLFAVQMDTLNRGRGKAPSEQRVTVEHVNVYGGGQAVVGNVTAGTKSAPGGGGEEPNL